MTIRSRDLALSGAVDDYSETMVAAWPLIGRAEELDRLRESTTPAAHGVVLSGPAGVGKTRLAAEVLAYWQGQGRWCRWFVATRSAQSVPLGVFAEVIETDVHDSVGRIRSVVNALTGDGSGDRVLLVIDDAHLLDEQSALALHQIVRHSHADVLLTMRSGEPAPDAVTGLWKDQLIARLDLQPLSQEETTDLLTRTLGGHLESSAAAGLWRFTRGNVLHLRHLVEGERADGRLSERDGVWVWEGRPEISAPLTELIDAGIARQPAPVLVVVDLVSVADPLEVAVLTALCDPDAVEAAHRAGLIVIDTDAAPAVARLAHPLLGEVRRARSLPTRLQALRSKVARQLELHDNAPGPIMLVRRAVLMCGSDLAPDSDLLIDAARAALRLSDPITAERLARHAVAAGGGYRAHWAHVGGLIDTQRFREAHEITTMLAASAKSPRERVAMTVLAAVIKDMMVGPPGENCVAALENEAAAAGLRGIYDAAVACTAAFQINPARAVEAAQVALDSAELFNEDYELVALMGLTTGNAMLGRYSAMAAPAERGYVMGRNSTRSATAHLLHSVHHLLGLYTGGYLAQAAGLVAQLTREQLDFPLAYSYWEFIEGLVAIAHGDLAVTVQRCREARAVNVVAESTWTQTWALLQQVTAVAMSGDNETAATLLQDYHGPGSVAAALSPPSVLLLTRAWVGAAAGVTSRAVSLAVEAAEIARGQHFFAHEVLCRQTAVQFGDRNQARRLTELVAIVEGPRVAAAALHATGLETGDCDGLCEAAGRYEQFGDRIAAADTFAQAANLLRDRGLRGAALTAAASAERLSAATGAATPALRSLRCPCPLTARQREVIALVAAGLTNRQIAEQLVTSIRTVEGHLFRASQRTGISSREGLATLVDHST